MSWAVTPHALMGKSVIKISLKTGDDALARRRWGEIHFQIEALIEETVCAVKKTVAPAGPPPSSLSSPDRAAIAAQARHDVLANHDADWTDPDDMTPLARGLEQALRLRDAGALKGGGDGGALDEVFFRHLAQFPAGMTRGQIREAARLMEAEGVADMLRSGRTWPLDAPTALVEEVVVDANAPTGERVVGSAQSPGELTQRLAENGFALEDELERRKVAHAVLMAKAAGFQGVQARIEGRMVETPSRPAAPGASESKEILPTILEMHDIWARRTRPDGKTKDDNKLYVERFVSMHGDLRVNIIERKHIREFRDELEKFPSAMPAHIARKPFREIVAWAEKTNAPRLSRVTVNAKGLGSLSALMSIAVTEYDLSGDPSVGLRLPIEDCDVLERHPFTPPLLYKVRASPVFQNPPKVSKGGCGAAAFWMPLISLYSGARVEEIGQIPLSDILEEAGITYFWFREDEDDDADQPRRQRRGRRKSQEEKSIKSKAGRRRVPVHPALIELGFLEYLAARRAAGDKMLFPQLEPYRGRYTKNWSRWWGRYQDRHITDDEAFVFHSFRHSFIGRMRAAEIPLEYMKGIVGHARELDEPREKHIASDVTEGYGDASPIRILNILIQKVDYPGLKFERIEAFLK
ncbi:MAG: site-specific integrase [Rhodoblastus sp.]|uniref:site-specific integrase n=1 Tax=Rhodoblastus sp. TaxID=1962975 RepID=UPI003FD6E5B8